MSKVNTHSCETVSAMGGEVSQNLGLMRRGDHQTDGKAGPPDISAEDHKAFDRCRAAGGRGDLPSLFYDLGVSDFSDKHSGSGYAFCTVYGMHTLSIMKTMRIITTVMVTEWKTKDRSMFSGLHVHRHPRRDCR